MIEKNSCEFKLAKIEDCDLIYSWANDPEVRKNSFDTEHIKYEDHCKWFEGKLKSSTSNIYIFYDSDVPTGQVRLDIDELKNQAIISYLIAPNKRGQGYGTRMLLALEELIKAEDINITTLVAEVKKDNFPSNNIFEKLGYSKEEVPEGYFVYRKLL